ncbi:tumor necrosis factor receptor superfamily member 21-like [Denticeps clupeoides]|uniref:Tumor necrosis factor receptor superfamily member 21 n=1 Tax=Denticeps clupeoides TaxID=299321 RepID=A0AAY4ATN6_9TELE|nr:tumor necrosis factor receptor superfamily member 21-like [Denticeps clupeoides]
MSKIFVCVMLLSALVGGGAAQATEALSPRHYHHVDPGTGSQLVCDKCPAGTHVSRHCTESSVRECSRCAEGAYTRGENGVEQCHRCRRRCTPPFVEKVPCTSTSDRVCACPPGTFVRADTCQRHARCPEGQGVKKRGSETEDVRCRPCPRGTFSDVASDVLRCRTHANCSAQGLVLLAPGTDKADSLCGPGPAHLPAEEEPTPPAPPSAGAAPQDPSDPELSLSSLAAPRPSGDLDGDAGATEEPGRRPPPARRPANASEVQQPPANQEAEGRGQAPGYRPTRRGAPKPSMNQRFDINEHLPWMIVLLLLLVLVVIVVCSVKRSSRVLKKGPRQDPSSIVEKALHKKPCTPTQVRERWIYYSNGQRLDILKLVAAQIGSQWVDMYKSLASATEREVAAFSNGYSADHERAYAALQHWTIRDCDANLAKLINALHRHRRIDVVEKIRLVMEDNPQFDLTQLMTSVNVSQCLSPSHKPLESPGAAADKSPVDRTRGFFVDESEPLLRCDSTSSKDSALSRTGSFITKEKKDTVLRQVRLDPCDLQPIFDDMLHILNPDELHVIDEIPMAEDKLDRLFEIAGVKSQEASQTLLDSVYSHLPDLL